MSVGTRSVLEEWMDEDNHQERLARAQAEIARLEVALESSRLIGAAVGIAMQRYGLDRATAFAFLRRTSQDTNRKIREIAEELVQGQDELARAARVRRALRGA